MADEAKRIWKEPVVAKLPDIHLGELEDVHEWAELRSREQEPQKYRPRALTLYAILRNIYQA
jgi:hypothetical protein